jgi:D-alanine-D-alanine ligase
MLEMLGVPYVGSGVLASALTMDKAMVKVVLGANGILTARSVTLEAHTVLDTDVEAMLAAAEISLPCFVKPARLGSSVGISKVTDIDGLAPALDLAFQHDSKVLIEAMVHGMEIECGVLGTRDPMVSVPGRLHVNADWYDYAAKYDEGGSDILIPADVPDDVALRVQDMAVSAFRAMEAAGMARVDFFLRPDGGLLVNEVNTIPGFAPTSVYARLFAARGLDYGALVNRLVELGLERHERRSRYRY